MATEVLKAIHKCDEAGLVNIAVICRSGDRCSRVAVELHRQGFDTFAVAASSDFVYRGGVVVLPAHLAKGMEFDAALVIDVDDEAYDGTDYDSALLYVALTRGLHCLHVFAVGRLSALIPLSAADASDVDAEPIGH